MEKALEKVMLRSGLGKLNHKGIFFFDPVGKTRRKFFVPYSILMFYTEEAARCTQISEPIANRLQNSSITAILGFLKGYFSQIVN